MIRSLMAAAAAVFLVAPAHATIIDYTFNAEFEDGSAASGGFRFDSMAGTVSNTVIDLTAGTIYGPANFDIAPFTIDFGNRFAFAVLDTTDGPDYSGDVTLNLRFFTDGDLLNPIIDFTNLGMCTDSGCTNRTNLAGDLSSSLVGVEVMPNPVPVPAAAPLMLAGLGALGLRRRRKTA